MSEEPKNEEPAMVDEEVGEETAPAVEAPAATTELKTMAEDVSSVDDTQLSMFIVLIAGVILLIATGAEYNWGNYDSYAAYAMSVSSVSIALSGISLLMQKFAADLHEKHNKHMNLLLSVWSFVGACFLTFDKPFNLTSNGYFAAWTVVFGSAMANGLTAGMAGGHLKGMGAINGLLVSSLVVVLASIRPVADNHTNYNEALYAMVLSCVTFVIFGMLVFMDNRGKEMLTAKPYFGMLGIFTIFWIVMACFVTFRGPFDVTGNGYFGSWIGAATCAFATFAAKADI